MTSILLGRGHGNATLATYTRPGYRMKRAAIDLGRNSFHAMVVEVLTSSVA